MRRSILMLTLLAAALWSAPALAQQRNQLGPLCTTDTTPADQQIDACNKIIALKVFSGEKLATIYFWRAVGWNKKGNYTQVIADATEAIRLKPDSRALQSARLGLLRQGRVRHRDRRLQRRAADRAAERHHLSQPRQRLARQGRLRQGDRRLRRSRSRPIRRRPFPIRTAASSKQALGDLDGALADINEAIRLDPTLPHAADQPRA